MLRCVLGNGEAGLVGINKPSVDRPLAIEPVPREVPGHYRRLRSAWQLIERLGGRIAASVLYGFGTYPELQELVPLPSRENYGRLGGAAAKELLQTVFENHCLPSERFEVDDDIDTLRHTDSCAFYLYRLGQKVSVIGD